jgi:dolichol-phosphate mannosyltransferase
MVGWLIWVSTAVLGHTEYAVRMGAFLCWLIAAVYVYKLARAMSDALVALRTLLLMSVLPIFFSVGLFMTPDAPLVACWAGALYYLHKSLAEECRSAWLGVGIFMGLGMLSKYSIALLGMAGLVLMLLDRESRRWFRCPEPYLAAILAAILFSSVIIWNAQNEWASFVFQGPRRFSGDFDFDLPDLMGSVLLLITPAGLLAVLAAVASKRSILPNGCDGKANRSHKLLVISTLLPLFVFVFFSLSRNIKVNWTGPVWLGVLPYMAAFTIPHCRVGAGRLAAYARRAWPATIATMLVLWGVAGYYLVLGFPGIPYPSNVLGVGMADLARQMDNIVAGLEREVGEKPFTVCMDTDRMAGWIAFYRVKGIQSPSEAQIAGIVNNITGGHFVGKDSHMYRYWHPTEMFENRVIMLIGREPIDFLKRPVRESTEPIGDIEEIVFRSHDKVSGRFLFRLVRLLFFND